MNSSTGVLLDTTVLIDALRNRNNRRAWLAMLVRGGSPVAGSVVSMAEIYAGLRPGEEGATQTLLEALDWIPVSVDIARRAGDLKADLRRSGMTRSITDMLVAATALESGFAVATDNQKDFQIPGLELHPVA